MERIINIKLKESDAKVLMALLSSESFSNIEARYNRDMEENRRGCCLAEFEKVYDGYTPEKGNALSLDLYSVLYDALIPSNYLAIDLTDRT